MELEKKIDPKNPFGFKEIRVVLKYDEDSGLVKDRLEELAGKTNLNLRKVDYDFVPFFLADYTSFVGVFGNLRIPEELQDYISGIYGILPGVTNSCCSDKSLGCCG